MTSKTSVVIPLFGGEDDISQCLTSLSKCAELVNETIVVDNCSPDFSANVAAKFRNVRVVRMGANAGFSAACNRGFEKCSNDTVIFLNSDTVVPKIGLDELLKSLWASPSIAVAGPLSNYSGYHQGICVPPECLQNLDAFAAELASRNMPDIPVDMLTGFCMAVRAEIFDSLGGFDEEFRIGTWEDNDLCYRCIRAGFQLRVAARSFVYHHGSRSFARSNSDVGLLYHENRSRFIRKWQKDLDSGFASGLPGLSDSRIVFKRMVKRT